MSLKKRPLSFLGDMGIFTLNQMRFELIYFRFFKKVFRRRFLRTKMLFSKPKYWLLLRPNFLLTIKSKNSRMGAGVGTFIRLTCNVKKGAYVLRTKKYSIKTLIKFKNYIKKKINCNFGLYSNCYISRI